MSDIHPQPNNASDVFTQDIPADRPAVTLDRDVFRTPQIVQYKGPRWIEYEKDGSTQRTKKQLLATQAGHGPWVAIWGSMNLDSQLRKLKLGAVLRLRYLGVDDTVEGDRKPHLWEVTATTASMAQVDELRGKAPWPAYERALLDAVERAKAENLARRDAAHAATEEPPPPDDEDRLPF